MTQRPTFIDLGSRSYDSGANSPSSSGLPSPRITYFDGEIPPAMSPLDAFAEQSRLLAKQLDDSQRQGRRVSRLPPIAIAESLATPRPGYFRSKSAMEEAAAASLHTRSAHEELSGSRTELEEPTRRPRSYYPRMSHVPPTPEDLASFPLQSPDGQPFATSFEYQPSVSSDYFGAPRSSTIEQVTSTSSNALLGEGASPRKSTRSFDSLHRRAESQQDLSIESSSSRAHHPNSLVPPNQHHVRQAASIRSFPTEISDDETTTYSTESSISQPRTLSSSSAVSMPHSPLSPFVEPHVRSESVNSEYSLGGSHLSRPAFNFSRPLSRNSRPSESSSRQASSDSQIYGFTNDSGQNAMPTENEEFYDTKEHPTPPAPSYIYAKFSLPRGRMMQRNSIPLEQEGTLHSERKAIPAQSESSPVTPPLEERSQSSLPTPPHSIESVDLLSHSVERLSMDNTDPTSTRPPSIHVSNLQHRQSLSSTKSGSTIKAQSPRKVPPSAELSVEEHLSKGIDCHERGSLKESTYHLRIAARQNHPTAMLLYALACRHGWGMRANQQEGVQWLRKAMDSASIELRDDADNPSGSTCLNRGSPTDINERKTRRAQFALSVYELGVSHMNGWGIEQDKSLALRCFEIAANWGDADAMAEAGFCYAQAVGCKKDLKKAARYYRMAEGKGMSMVGNSWYVLFLSLSLSLSLCVTQSN